MLLQVQPILQRQMFLSDMQTTARIWLVRHTLQKLSQFIKPEQLKQPHLISPPTVTQVVPRLPSTHCRARRSVRSCPELENKVGPLRLSKYSMESLVLHISMITPTPTTYRFTKEEVEWVFIFLVFYTPRCGHVVDWRQCENKIYWFVVHFLSFF